MDLGLTYTKIGDYYYPDITLSDTTKYHIGMYGRKHERYLKEYRPKFDVPLPEPTPEELAEIEKVRRRRARGRENTRRYTERKKREKEKIA